MGKRGKCPSLIGGGAGAVKFVTALRKRTCKRCDQPIPKRDRCAEVKKPGTMGARTYCLGCFEEILDQTEQDLAKLREQARAG